MIAVCVNQSVDLFFEGEDYNRNDPKHQQIMFECASLQWIAKQALKHVRDNGYYYCAVYKSRVVEVYEMDRIEPLISIADAESQGLIEYTEDSQKRPLWEVTGFQKRKIGMLHNWHERPVGNRIYFLNSKRAPEDIAKQWLDRYERFYGNTHKYIATPEYA
jgi:hypothetical protein